MLCLSAVYSLDLFSESVVSVSSDVFVITSLRIQRYVTVEESHLMSLQ